MFMILSILVLSTSVFATDISPPCKQPLSMGKTPCKEKPSIRFHLDQDTETCLAFEYTGCGGNSNNFESASACDKACIKNGRTGCAAGKPLSDPATCRGDDACPSSAMCIGEVCCSRGPAIKAAEDYSPKCPAGKKVYKIKTGDGEEVLVGKNCKSKFCPVGATCVEGNYVASCCK